MPRHCRCRALNKYKNYALKKYKDNAAVRSSVTHNSTKTMPLHKLELRNTNTTPLQGATEYKDNALRNSQTMLLHRKELHGIATWSSTKTMQLHGMALQDTKQRHGIQRLCRLQLLEVRQRNTLKYTAKHCSTKGQYRLDLVEVRQRNMLQHTQRIPLQIFSTETAQHIATDMEKIPLESSRGESAQQNIKLQSCPCDLSTI